MLLGLEHKLVMLSATGLSPSRVYFDVDKKSTKTEIKKWIEGFFGVKVIRINSHRPPKKKKQIRSRLSRLGIKIPP